MASFLLEKECGKKCKSRKHVGEIISAIIHGNLAEFKAVSVRCHNWTRHSDIFGRTALHIAATCGKVDIVEWLLEEMRCDLAAKDQESGYTAMHRAVFHGQLHCARMLTQFGCDLQARDVEGMTPLDLLTADSTAHLGSIKEPSETFTWGENNNSTLGHASPHKRTCPEVLDYFKKEGVSLKQVVLCKYHSVFLSQAGEVFTCGHGLGGRLGHEDEHTVIQPRLVEAVKDMTCLEVAAATDHTVLRMEGGAVYSFGLNTYHQLAQTPFVESSPVPKQMNLKPLKGKKVIGACVGRFHSVLWTKEGSVYTVGLNAGQLGHPKDKVNIQSMLREVPIRCSDLSFKMVTCSDAATVCLTKAGEIYVLHEYLVRKISYKWHAIDQILVMGGNLDHVTDEGNKLREQGGKELMVMCKTNPDRPDEDAKNGELYLWRSSNPSFKRCTFGLKRQVTVTHVSMTPACILFSTNEGAAYVGHLHNRKQQPQSKTNDARNLIVKKELLDTDFVGYNSPDGRKRLLDLLLKDETEEFTVRRVPFVHRAVATAVDRKGGNFVVIQPLPNGSLTELPVIRPTDISDQLKRLHEEADLGDATHDAVLKVGERSWPVHKYILASRSDHLKNLVLDGVSSEASGASDGQPLVLDLGQEWSPELVEQLMLHIYTDDCHYLQAGYTLKQGVDNSGDHMEFASKSKKKKGTNLGDTKGMSAFQVEQKRNQKKMKSEKSETNIFGLSSHNPVVLLQQAARKFGVKGLAKKLDAVKCKDNVIVGHKASQVKPKVKFDRKKLPELYDVTIRAEGGGLLHCHKCVLVARLEYFCSMLSTGWAESHDHSTLTLPVTMEVLEILIDYLYSDEALQLRDCANEELLCNVLVVADQLLAWRLKEMCEVALANILSFRNIGELLEFSQVYNAEQLASVCVEFVWCNLSNIIEGRHLDICSPETLQELTEYYREVKPSMSRRHMTSCGERRIPQEELDTLVEAYESMNLDAFPMNEQTSDKKGNKQLKKQKQQRSRNKSTSEDIERTVSMSESHSELDISYKTLRSTVDPIHDDEYKPIISQQDEDDKKIKTDKLRNRNKTKWLPANVLGAPKDSIMRISNTETTKQPESLLYPTKPVQPDDVPQWAPRLHTLAWAPQTAPQGPHVALEVSTDAPPPSPRSPGGAATNLRDIMEREEAPSEKVKAASSRRVSWKEIKKQQSQKPADSPSPSEASPSPTQAPSSPWASSVGGVVKSFRDLMLIEESRAPPSPMATSPPHRPQAPTPNRHTPHRAPSQTSPPSGASKAPVAGLSWGLAAHSSAARSIPLASPALDDASPTMSGSIDNPWAVRAAQMPYSPPSVAPIATAQFYEILQDEKKKKQNLEQTLNKPLALIQLEENAMLELLKYYKADKAVDEYITVERVHREIAAPVWNRERTVSGSGTYRLV